MRAPTEFYTSDTHYGHDNIRKHAGRPFATVEEMDAVLVANHNAVVQPQDTVWFLGDFSFGKLEGVKAVLKRLNGHKHLILGNHDKVLRQKPVALMGHGLFESIDTYRFIRWKKQTIVLFHYGMRVWDKCHHGSWHLYGHSHGNLPPHNKSVDVGVDARWITGKAEYTPFSFEQVAAFMATREFRPVDHHGAGYGPTGGSPDEDLTRMAEAAEEEQARMRADIDAAYAEERARLGETGDDE